MEMVSVSIPYAVKSHPVFLFMKEEVSSLLGKDFNPQALIQASMLS